jgi:hypothetical protein
MVTVRDGTGMTENLIRVSTGATVAVTDVGGAGALQRARVRVGRRDQRLSSSATASW